MSICDPTAVIADSAIAAWLVPKTSATRQVRHPQRPLRAARGIAGGLHGKGRIVEAGTHDDLLARDGTYAALWAVQTGALA